MTQLPSAPASITPNSPKRWLRAAASALLGRSSLAQMMGKTFGGNRDLYNVLGYKRALEFADYAARYERGGIAFKVVTAFPQATWRYEPIVKSKNGGKGSRFNRDFEELSKRTKLFHYLDRVDRLSGIGKYGTLLIGVSGGRPMEEPIAKLNGPKDVLYFTCYTQDNSEISKLEADHSDERFGMPSEYLLKPFANVEGLPLVGGLTGMKLQTHYSRLIHIAEGLNEDEIFGTPRMQAVWNYLDDLDKVVGGTAEAIWKVADRGIQWDIDKDADLAPEDEAAFAEEIENYVHGNQRYVRTQGVTATVLGSDIPDPKGPAGMLISLISGTTGIPQRVLLGAEAGQLASEQDDKNFNARVNERQKAFAEPMILRQVVDRLIEIGGLPEPAGGYEIEWPDLANQTLRDTADVAARYAQAIANFSSQGKGGGVKVVSPSEFREKFLKLPPEVPQFELIVPPKPPQSAPGKPKDKQTPVAK